MVSSIGDIHAHGCELLFACCVVEFRFHSEGNRKSLTLCSWATSSSVLMERPSGPTWRMNWLEWGQKWENKGANPHFTEIHSSSSFPHFAWYCEVFEHYGNIEAQCPCFTDDQTRLREFKWLLSGVKINRKWHLEGVISNFSLISLLVFFRWIIADCIIIIK